MSEHYVDELESIIGSEFYEQSGVFEQSIVVPLRFMQYLAGVRISGIPRADRGFYLGARILKIFDYMLTMHASCPRLLIA